jgi:TPR repeat protein
LYSKGLGVTRNYDRAFELLQWACTRADGEACAGLATLYARGHGAPPDMVQSESLFRRACDLGDNRGCSGLAAIKAWRQQAGN